jgi:hypothetical protein
MEKPMPTWLIVLLALAFIGAVLATMPAGRRLRSRLPIPGLRPGAAPQQQRVQSMLDVARQRNPDMREAEAYRWAIRRYLRDKPRDAPP